MPNKHQERVFFLMDIPIDNVTMDQAIAMIWARMEEKTPSEMHFVNAHCINVAAKDPVYHEILKQSKAVFADGTGIRKAGEKLGHPIVDNVNGTDLFPLICTECKRTGKSVFLLGGKPGVAEKSAQWSRSHAQGDVIAGFHDGFFTDADALIKEINASQADLLLVGMGVPRQEKWLHEHLGALTVPVVMGVGGLFDFYSGTISRSPLWMRRMGIEWVWRLMMEPRRMWKRYIIGNVAFLIRINMIKRAQQKQRKKR
ncbi:MAG: WecB/TagA/CpsF family glycosyltransferase [Sphaerochaeta sp.]|nr:WecB/TagA/CpsF family glycosyltransferase [Sphaerochaeta sp.]